MAEHWRMVGVLSTMDMVRELFRRHRCDVSLYTDRDIAATLLELCPQPNDWWLSPEHLRETLTLLHTRQGTKRAKPRSKKSPKPR